MFYTTFYGDKVIAVNPDQAMLKKYGLGDGDEIYVVAASNANNDLPTFFISKAIYDEEEDATFHYTSVVRDGATLLIRIPEQAFIPQNQFKDVESKVFDENKLINWASTNSVGSGFYQAIQGDGVQFAGVDRLTIKVPTSVYQYGEETFHIEYVSNSNGEKIPKITTSSGRYEDKGPEKGKPFNTFYRILISYPDVVRFNALTDAEIAQFATDANLMYSIEAVMNDGKVEKFEYFRISSEYVMVCVTTGEYKNGQLEMGARKCIFDSTRAQIEDAIYVAFNQLLNGEKIEVK